MLANRALNADDDHGREHGLVIQADELRWPELQALAEVVKPVLDFVRHMATNAVSCPGHRPAAVRRGDSPVLSMLRQLGALDR